MSKKKLKSAPAKLKGVPKIPPAPAQIPKDLEAQLQSIRAFAMVHNLLNAGAFPFPQMEGVRQGLEFMKGLHAHAVSVAAMHPQADLVPELKVVNDAARAPADLKAVK